MEKLQAVPREFCKTKITRPWLLDVAGEGGAYGGGGGGVEEEQSRYGEEDDEEEGGAEVVLKIRRGFLGFVVEGHFFFRGF